VEEKIERAIEKIPFLRQAKTLRQLSRSSHKEPSTNKHQKQPENYFKYIQQAMNG